MIGTTVSHYRIAEKLGEGGMGIVYKAHDTKLDRDVALKFLPDRVNKDATAKERFLQEAQAAAALNHPNICTIYGIEEADGKTFIAMEFVDGKTLRELKTFNSKLETVLGYAAQIGDALHEAHSHGIVHRDVKAENIMVNSKNQIKVMDFGLAKLKGSLKLTKTSSTVGTLAYMAPEQIQGGEVDSRSDIFSFGVVLFEMLTGHLPFRGEHEAAMMYSIVNEEAMPLQQFVPEASSELIHVVNTALEKNTEERYQSASEMVRDLRRAQKQTSRVSRTRMSTGQVAASVPSPQSTPTGFRLRKNIWFAIAVGVIVIIAAAAVLLLHEPAAELNPNYSNHELQIPLTQMTYPTLSKDGNSVYFFAADEHGKWDLWTTPTSQSHEKVRRITSDSISSQALVDGPEISPDGSQVVYWFGYVRNELRLVNSNGGESQHVCWDAYAPHWIPPDGNRIAYVHLDPTVPFHGVEFRSVRPDGRDDRPEFLDTLSAGIRPFSFSYSPDGKGVVWIRNCRDSSYEEVLLRNLETGKELQLTHERKHIDEVCWGPNDQILFSSNRRGSVMVYMVSASGGDPVPLPVGGSEAMRISRDGKKLLCFHNQQIGHIWLARSDGSNARQLTHDENLAGEPFLSPDGKHIAYYVQDVNYLSFIWEIYVMDRDGKNPQKITQLDSALSRPLWSPDGRWIACFSQNIRSGDAHTYIVDPLRSDPPKPIGRGWPIAWRNNGEVVVFDSARSWIVAVDGKSRRQFYKDSTRAIPVLGGDYILYADWSKSRKGVWIVPAEGNSQPRQILPKQGNYPLIAPSDKYFLYADRGIYSRVSLPSGKLERLPKSIRNLNGNSISVSPDGSEIVYVKQENRGKMTMYENMFK